MTLWEKDTIHNCRDLHVLDVQGERMLRRHTGRLGALCDTLLFYITFVSSIPYTEHTI